MPNTVIDNDGYPSIYESDRLYARATGLIPAYTQTLAKGPTQHVKGVAPKYLCRGQSSHVWDVDGNEYLDYNTCGSIRRCELAIVWWATASPCLSSPRSELTTTGR